MGFPLWHQDRHEWSTFSLIDIFLPSISRQDSFQSSQSKKYNLWYFKQHARRFKTHQNTCGFGVNWKGKAQRIQSLTKKTRPHFICNPHEFVHLHEAIYPDVRACLAYICKQNFSGLRMTHQRVLTRAYV